MSSKRKWDQAADDGLSPTSPPKASKTDDVKSASEAAAAAAAIAAKIAAQLVSSAGAAGIMGGGGMKDPHDGDFTHDIDINDVRNRYVLTKGSTQTQVRFRQSQILPLPLFFSFASSPLSSIHTPMMLTIAAFSINT
jgi:hypothetical protein